VALEIRQAVAGSRSGSGSLAGATAQPQPHVHAGRRGGGSIARPRSTQLRASPARVRPSIQALRQDLGERVGGGFVVHTGDVRLPIAPGVTAIPFREL